MATLMQTLGRWAEGRNAVDAAPAERRTVIEGAIGGALPRLRRHSSLADLAGDYYADESWFRHLAAEFDLAPVEGESARGAAYWARFMEIRHPRSVRSPR